MRHTIELDEERELVLRRLAEREGRTVDAVVQQAVDDYLARKRDRDELWARFDAAQARIHAGIPSDMTAQEIDAEIDAAVSEVRASAPLHKRVKLHARPSPRDA